LIPKQYFGTDGIRGRVGEPPMSVDWILHLGWAFGRVLHSIQEVSAVRCKVLIGKDTRVSGYLFESALEAGLSAAGVDTVLLGPMPTPAIAQLTRELSATAGVVISASHNPYYDNGIKFFSAKGTKLPDDLELAIESKLSEPITMVDSRQLGKAERLNDAEERYVEFCKNTVPLALPLQFRDFKIVLDCAHGATYHVAPTVFRELGADVIEMGVKPDGYNINENCGSLYPRLLAEHVIHEQADVGIALDGDGDRIIMVDHQGVVVDGDELLFILATWYAATGRLKGGVVGTLMSNFGLELALRLAGIDFCRAQVGDRHVLELLEKKAWNLGGESSGHIICLDANTTGDGILCALRILTIMQSTGRTLAELKRGMTKLPQVLINVPVMRRSRVIEYPPVQRAIQAMELRLQGRGRVLLRASGTESLVRVMVEGEEASVIQEIAAELVETLQNCLTVTAMESQ